MRVFHPHARSYRHRTIQQTFRAHGQEKRGAYDSSIQQVDGGSFMPLVFTTTGGAGPAASVFLKDLGSKIAEKKDSSRIHKWSAGFIATCHLLTLCDCTKVHHFLIKLCFCTICFECIYFVPSKFHVVLFFSLLIIITLGLFVLCVCVYLFCSV